MAKAGAKEENQYLEHIVILGQDIKATLVIEEAQEKQGRIHVIGDGVEDLTTEEILLNIKRIQSKIGPSTQVHINFHGFNKTTYPSPTLLEVHLNKYKPILLRGLFEEFAKIHKAPLNVSLYSCYSGTGKDDFTSLPEGSTLTTSAGPESARMNMQNEMEILRSLRNKSSPDPFSKFIYSLCIDGHVFSSFGIRIDGHEEAFSSRTQCRAYSSDEIMRWQRFEIDRFIKHCDKIKEGFTETQQRQFESLKESLGRDILDSTPEWLRALQEDNIQGYRLSLFFNLISENKEKDAMRLIDAMENVNIKNQYGNTALMIAANKGKHKLVEKLLEAEASVNAQAKNGATALIYASETGDPRIVKALTDAGADVNAAAKNGTTALMIAASKGKHKLVEKLIAAGADVNIHAQDGSTALIYAAEIGDPRIIKALIDAGADVNAATENGTTALLDAVQNGNYEAVKALLEAGADVDAPDKDGTTALLKATAKENYESAKDLIEAGIDVNAQDKNGWTALLLAVSKGNYRLAKTLIDAGADINSAQKDGWSPIMYAAHREGDETAMLDTSITKLLLDHGANICKKQNETDTPLHIFVSRNMTKGLSTLLDSAGAGCGVKTKEGDTILHLAAISGSAEIMINKILSHPNSKYIDLSAKNKSGETALDIAKNKGINSDTLSLMERKMHPPQTWKEWARDTTKSVLPSLFAEMKAETRKKPKPKGKKSKGTGRSAP